MAIAFRSVTTTASGSSAAPAITKPASTASGDVCIVMMRWGNATNNVNSTPTGFTAIGATPLNPGGGSGVRYGLWYKYCDGTEGATLTFGLVASGSWRIAAVTYQGSVDIDATADLSGADYSDSTTAGTAVNIPSMAVTRSNSMAVVCSMYDGNTATWTQPTSFNERLDSGGFAIGDLAFSSDTGTLTSTKSGGSDICVGIGVLIQPKIASSTEASFIATATSRRSFPSVMYSPVH